MDTLFLCFLMNFLIQCVGFIFAYALQTEKFFDCFGKLILRIRQTVLICDTINNKLFNFLFKKILS